MLTEAELRNSRHLTTPEMTCEAFARLIGSRVSTVNWLLRCMGTNWTDFCGRKPGQRVCLRKHPISARKMIRGKVRCEMCEQIRVVKKRDYSKEKKVRTEPAPPPPQWTWQDYAEQTDREFATPHWLRKAPAIKAWLIANKIKPVGVDGREQRDRRGQ